jgi:hypothetical protein
MLVLAISVKQADTPLKSSCAGDASAVAALPAGTPLKLRYALSGESAPCYKVSAELNGKTLDGYLPASAIDGLDTFDKDRRAAESITLAEALHTIRASQPLPALTGGPAPSGLRPSMKVVLAQAEELIEASQPAKALALLEPELKKFRDPALLSMAGMAAWRADDASKALDYWRESLAAAPNPGLEKLYRQVEGEQRSDGGNEKLFGIWAVLRYDPQTVPKDTAREMLNVVDRTFARVSSQLGCTTEEKIVTIVQSRDDYNKATGAAEWSGGQYDGRIRLPAMTGQQMTREAEQALAHETAHACLTMLGDWPSWLHEGMAQKLSGARLPAAARKSIADLAQQGKLPKLENLRQGWSGLDAEHARIAYAMALAAVDVLFDRFGADGVRNLMRNPERLQQISAELDKELGL